MAAFFSEYLSTLVIGAIVFAVIVLIIAKMIKDRRKGKSSCGCGCSNCPSSGICHNNK